MTKSVKALEKASKTLGGKRVKKSGRYPLLARALKAFIVIEYQKSSLRTHVLSPIKLGSLQTCTFEAEKAV